MKERRGSHVVFRSWRVRSAGRRWGVFLMIVAALGAGASTVRGRDAAASAATPVFAARGTPASAELGSTTDRPAAVGVAAHAPSIDGLLRRAERAERLWQGVESFYEEEIAPIERVLLSYRYDPPLVRRIARALVAEARKVAVEPRLLLAVLLVENPWLDPDIRSSVGAVGLMQVMPWHSGNWGPCRPDLEDVEANICHGARIFVHYFRLEDGDIERALLRYNGCVRGTNTPDCHRYPYHVYARAGRASILAWLRPAVVADATE